MAVVVERRGETVEMYLCGCGSGRWEMVDY